MEVYISIYTVGVKGMTGVIGQNKLVFQMSCINPRG